MGDRLKAACDAGPYTALHRKAVVLYTAKSFSVHSHQRSAEVPRRCICPPSSGYLLWHLLLRWDGTASVACGCHRG